MPLSPQLQELLVCPQCKGPLEVSAQDRLICTQCQLAYPVRDNVPVMLIDEAQPVEC